MSLVVRAVAPPLLRWQKIFPSPQTTVSTVPHRLSLLSSRSFRRHFRSQGLRLPRETVTGSSDDVSDESTAEKKKKSRNEMKREARVSVRFGMDLASFSTPQIKRILKAASLEEEVFEALMLVKRLGPDVREGKRRQFNYIGKMLRGAQPDLLGALIQATKDGDQSRFQALAGSTELIDDDDTEEEFYESESELELEGSSEHLVLANRWCDGLISKDIQISNEVYAVEDVDFDRQELRRLVRKVHNVQDGQNGIEDDTSAELIAAKKSLNLFLSSLAKRLLLSSAHNAPV